MEEKEESLGMQAAMEQGEEGLLQMAKIMGTYFKELRKQGFSRYEAFQMIRDFSNRTLKRGSDEPNYS